MVVISLKRWLKLTLLAEFCNQLARHCTSWADARPWICEKVQRKELSAEQSIAVRLRGWEIAEETSKGVNGQGIEGSFIEQELLLEKRVVSEFGEEWEINVSDPIGISLRAEYPMKIGIAHIASNATEQRGEVFPGIGNSTPGKWWQRPRQSLPASI